jgi:hypothetical protein
MRIEELDTAELVAVRAEVERAIRQRARLVLQGRGIDAVHISDVAVEGEDLLIHETHHASHRTGPTVHRIPLDEVAWRLEQARPPQP